MVALGPPPPDQNPNEFAPLEAASDSLGRVVAIRPLPAAVFSSLSIHVRALQMVGRACLVRSPNLAEVIGLATFDGRPTLVFEAVRGRSLEDWVTVHGPYSWPEVSGFVRQVGEGLGRLHAAGLVHDNLTSSNVRVPTQGLLKLTDLGLDSSVAPTTDKARAARKVYAAPERDPSPGSGVSEGDASPASDLFSLGMVALEMLTGAFPEAADPAALRAERLARVADPTGSIRLVLNALLADSPDARPPSVAAFLALLERQPVRQAPPEPARRRLLPARAAHGWLGRSRGGGSTRPS